MVTNVGVAVGSAAAGVALLLNTRFSYQILIAVDSATFLLAGALLTRMAAPRPSATRRSRRRRWLALRDKPYLLLTTLLSLLTLQHGMLQIGIPLWVVEHTAAPPSVVAVLFLINTLVIVAGQIRFSRGTENVGTAAAICRRGGLILAVACSLLAAATSRDAATTVGLLLAAGLAHGFGEVLTTAGSWGLAFELSDDRAPGEYQGLYSLSYSLAALLAPIVFVCVNYLGPLGWLIAGVTFVTVGLVAAPTARWVLKHRPRSA